MFRVLLIFVVIPYILSAAEMPQKPQINLELPEAINTHKELTLQKNFTNTKQPDHQTLPNVNLLPPFEVSEHSSKPQTVKDMRLIPEQNAIKINIHKKSSHSFIKYILIIDEGDKFYYFSPKHKDLNLDDFTFKFNTNNYSIDQTGNLFASINSDPIKTAQEGILLTYSYKNFISKSLQILPDFKPEFDYLNLTFPKATNGQNINPAIYGLKGQDGLHAVGAVGQHGLSGQEKGEHGLNGIHGHNATDAGHGLNGSTGLNGNAGKDGLNGNDRGKVIISIDEISAKATNEKLAYLQSSSFRNILIPASKAFQIYANGQNAGHGSDGGKGGNGGDGGKGGDSIGGKGGHGGKGARGQNGSCGLNASERHTATPGQNGQNGGDGGLGGNGGRGGIAGNGGDGGHGGKGGNGGNGGHGGNGAALTIKLKGSLLFQSLIKKNLNLSVKGGKGGIAGNGGDGGHGGKGGNGGRSLGGYGGKGGIAGNGGDGGHGGKGFIWDEFTGDCHCSSPHHFGSRNCPNSHRIWEYTGQCSCSSRHKHGSHGCSKTRSWTYSKYCNCNSHKHLWKSSCKTGFRIKIYEQHCNCSRSHTWRKGHCSTSRKFRTWRYTGFCNCSGIHRAHHGHCNQRFWITQRREHPPALDGLSGLPGKKGSHGLNGNDGQNGKNGNDGQMGIKGRPGQHGRNGKDGSVTFEN